MSRNLAGFEKGLTGLNPDERESLAKIVNNLAILLALDSPKQICVLQRQIERALAVSGFKSLVLTR